MATQAIPGFTGQLFASTSGIASSSSPATNPVAELGDVTLSVTRDTMDAFSKDSGGWDEAIYGKGKVTVAGKAIYHDTTGSTGQALLYDAIAGRTNVGLTFRGASSSGIIQYGGAALVTKWELQDANANPMMVDFGAQLTGAPFRVPSTS